MPVTVIPLLYSGRPNPQWRLSGPEAQQVEQALRDLPSRPAARMPPSALGYSGLLVIIDREGAVEEWRVAFGLAEHEGRCFADAGRRIEQALLGRGLAEEDNEALRRALSAMSGGGQPGSR